MCGIWGIVSLKETIDSESICKIGKRLFALSESRGKEASGISVLSEAGLFSLKGAIPASELVKSREYKNFINVQVLDRKSEEIFIIGHSRLVTNGSQFHADNNQPIVKKGISMVHNGIIVNHDKLWEENPKLNRDYEVDTEILVELITHFLDSGMSVQNALQTTYMKIEGMASIISLFSKEGGLVAASNNGSLYVGTNIEQTFFVFASEIITIQHIIKEFQKKLNTVGEIQIRQLTQGQVLFVNSPLIRNVKCTTFQVDKKSNTHDHEIIYNPQMYENFKIDMERIHHIKRCTKCVLPETMPFIKFDSDGVCNYCKTYRKQIYKGKGELYQWAESIKKQSSAYNSMVCFSGGRDSSYGLHFFVRELGLKPITYCYDWGMVTDLARRNQSRMCSKLGVEFIIVSADIRKKRENIRKNVIAWLKKPDIGMIPLFMAGDKHYYYYANQIKKAYHVNNVLLASNPFEKTYFKTGFCGIQPEILRAIDSKLDVERLPIKDIILLTKYYLSRFVQNPAYINMSICDTLSAAASYYIIPHDYFRLFDYIPWNEDIVDNTLLYEYGWEKAIDTKSTWRIGDGTSPLYNYIYYMVAGFTENDTLRSNQIREGMISREDALKLIDQDNAPRYDSIKWYFDIINLDMIEALKIINRIPKLY